MPIFRLARIVFRVRSVPVGKLDFEFVETKILHHREREIDAGLDFAFDLRGHAENVRVVLRKTAHAQQAVQHAAAFITINCA